MTFYSGRRWLGDTQAIHKQYIPQKFIAESDEVVSKKIVI